MLHPLPWRLIWVRNLPSGETHALCLRQGYTTSTLKLGIGFWTPANFRFSVDVTYYFVIQQWLMFYSFNAIDRQISPSSAHKIKGLGVFHKGRLKNMVISEYIDLELDATSQLIRSGPSDCLLNPVRVEVMCCKLLDYSVAWSKTARPPEYHP